MSDLNPDCENGTVTGGAGGAGERPLKHGAEYHPEPVCEPIAVIQCQARCPPLIDTAHVPSTCYDPLYPGNPNPKPTYCFLLWVWTPSSYAVSSPLQGVTQYGPRINCLLSNTHSGTTTPSLTTWCSPSPSFLGLVPFNSLQGPCAAPSTYLVVSQRSLMKRSII